MTRARVNERGTMHCGLVVSTSAAYRLKGHGVTGKGVAMGDG